MYGVAELRELAGLIADAAADREDVDLAAGALLFATGADRVLVTAYMVRALSYCHEAMREQAAAEPSPPKGE